MIGARFLERVGCTKVRPITGFNNIVGGKITLTAPPGDPFVS